jgi:hypothetical protein
MFGKPIAVRLTEGGLRPNERQISCKRTCENLRYFGAAGSGSAQRSSGQLAFVGCICKLGGSRSDPVTRNSHASKSGRDSDKADKADRDGYV